MLDYKKLGAKAGLEIHRQIESHKLFCHCPSELKDGEPDFTIKRKLRAVASETGEKDVVAEFEQSKGKYAVYEGFDDINCLVELDEEPIGMINDDALGVVLQVCKLLNMRIVDELQVMRKQVLDYSNTSSFQRTTLVGVDGYAETPSGRIKIESVCIEEDAARKMKEGEGYVVYRLDRLGIPLIEITTAPDMKNPEQVKEVAAYLGMILKSTGRFKSGLGTIRQDLNVSINGHSRVEIKGVQDLRLIPKIVDEEIRRQVDDAKNGRKDGEVRRVKQDGSTEFLRPMSGAARMYVETDHPTFSVKKVYDGIKVPELITEKTISLEERYRLSPHLSRALLKEKKSKLFEGFASKFKNVEANFIAQVLVEMPKEIKARFKDSKALRDSDFYFVLEHLNNKEIQKSSVFEILSELAKGKMVNLEQYKAVSTDKLEEEIRDAIKNNKGAPVNALVGIIMKKYRGRVDGKEVMEIIRKYTK